MDKIESQHIIIARPGNCQAAISTFLTLCLDLEDCRMEIHSPVWWSLQWSVCDRETSLDQQRQRKIFQATVCRVCY